MSKSLNRQNRQFGQNLLNTLSDAGIEANLALKPKARKKVDILSEEHVQTRPEMKYSDEILKYAFTKISYPHILKGPQKVKRDIEALLHEVTQMNGQNCIWHQDFLTESKDQDSYFCNKQITLEKRVALVEWIIAVHKKYTLREQTFHLTIKLIDEHCMKNDVPLSRYQLVGVAALFMAAKYEEIELPRSKDYSKLLPNNFTPQHMISTQAQILCKSQFLMTRKITMHWYLQAFGCKQVIFSRSVKYTRKRNQDEQDKQNSTSFSPNDQQTSQDRFEKFMSFCRYILNLVIVDYKVTTKYKQDIIAISALILGTFQKDFADADGKALLKYFSQTKQRLIQENESKEEICKNVKKCMKKLENLYSKRHDRKFNSVNEKFSNKDTKSHVN